MIVIISRGAGHGHAGTQARILDLFRENRAEVKLLVARDGAEMAGLAKEAAESDAEIVVGAGGDGTIDSIASVLAGTGKTLAVLPLGTFNLFAKRLGIPMNLESAVHTAVHGRPTAINAAEVNGRTFLSRSSPRPLPAGAPASRTNVPAFWTESIYRARQWRERAPALGSIMTIRLTSKGETRLFRTRFAFACNNPEELDYFHLRGRSCIEAGNLTLYLPKPLSKSGIIGLGLRLLARKTEENRDFEMVCAPEFHLEIEPSRVPVSLDGEVEMMEAPLRYRLLPGALRVRVPVMRDRTGMSG